MFIKLIRSVIAGGSARMIGDEIEVSDGEAVQLIAMNAARAIPKPAPKAKPKDDPKPKAKPKSKGKGKSK